MDRSLVSMMEGLGRGQSGPAAVKLMVGNMLVIGQPVSESLFADHFVHHETKIAHMSLHRKERTPEKWSELEALVEQNGGSLIAPMRSGAEPDGLCLINVEATIWTTERMSVPAMRIPIDKITAWWAGEAEIKSGGGGGSWFVGGLLPIGD